MSRRHAAGVLPRPARGAARRAAGRAVSSVAHRLRRPRCERGAVLVEVAMILPVLMIISLAVLELGMGWKASITVSSATRSGARVASNLGRAYSADEQALLAVSAALRSIPADQVERVVIFRATGASANVPLACLSGSALAAGGSSSSGCNVYSGADLDNLDSLAFTENCLGRQRFWCPTNRVNLQSAPAGLDWVGVYIKVDVAASTSMFGATIGIDDTTIMRIEPNAGNES